MLKVKKTKKLISRHCWFITTQRNQLVQRRSRIWARLATLKEQLRTAERRAMVVFGELNECDKKTMYLNSSLAT